jgi:trk system potassium uptake protein TrkH
MSVSTLATAWRFGIASQDHGVLPCAGDPPNRLWLALSGQYAIEPAFRHAAFNVVFGCNHDGVRHRGLHNMGATLRLAFLWPYLHRGCTGSTSGGIKIFRFEVMAVMLKAHFIAPSFPTRVFPRSYDGLCWTRR